MTASRIARSKIRGESPTGRTSSECESVLDDYIEIRAKRLAIDHAEFEAGPEHDPERVRFFHCRLPRQEALLGPALLELENASMPPLD